VTAPALDTGLDKPQRTIVQDGVVALLARLLRSNGGYLRTVAPYGGVVRSSQDEEGVSLIVEAVGQQCPAILVALGDRVSQRKGSTKFHGSSELEILVYHVSNHARSMTSGRQIADVQAIASASKDPGLHVIMEHTEELLVGQRVTPNQSVKQILPEREEELFTRPDITVWLQTYRVELVRTINRFRDVTQLLESIGWRTHFEAGEVDQPDPPTKPGTVDAITDLT